MEYQEGFRGGFFDGLRKFVRSQREERHPSKDPPAINVQRAEGGFYWDRPADLTDCPEDVRRVVENSYHLLDFFVGLDYVGFVPILSKKETEKIYRDWKGFTHQKKSKPQVYSPAFEGLVVHAPREGHFHVSPDKIRFGGDIYSQTFVFEKGCITPISVFMDANLPDPFHYSHSGPAQDEQVLESLERLAEEDLRGRDYFKIQGKDFSWVFFRPTVRLGSSELVKLIAQQ